MDHYIGKHVKYFDYLGLERFGNIIFIEPYHFGEPEDLYYIYIQDEEPEFNIHEIIVDGKVVQYAEIRINVEVFLDDK